MKPTQLRTIAIHLPQFHPIPENDSWWGKGFTEWTNVAKSRPLFKGHYQPHLPADLGFYDLRLEEARIAQAELAKEYGIYGFCYYHYWFNGKRLLERPADEILKSGKPDFPFMLCWANENWSRRWDGKEQDLLLEQEYSLEDDIEHIKHLCTFFKDPRYIRVEGKPVFAVYKTGLIPNPKKTADTWREIAREEGVGEIYLCRFESYEPQFKNKSVDPTTIGFDASVEFFPSLNIDPERDWGSVYDRLLHKLKIKPSPYLNNFIYDYSSVAKQGILRKKPSYKLYPGITPGWDNSARRKDKAVIYKNSTPQAYGDWLKNIVVNFKPYSSDENFLFINAWNEWAEGNHLEPCQKWGRAYLEATHKALTTAS